MHCNGLMSVDEGEVWGLLEALKWGKNLGFTQVVVGTDAHHVNTVVHSAGEDASLFGDYIVAARRILDENDQFEVCWTSRNANLVAHALARHSRDFECPYCWVEPPAFVDGLLDTCRSCM